MKQGTVDEAIHRIESWAMAKINLASGACQSDRSCGLFPNRLIKLDQKNSIWHHIKCFRETNKQATMPQSVIFKYALRRSY